MSAVEHTRLFCAVFPPREVAERIARTIDGLKKPDDGIAWVRAQNLHYTLRFLGDVGPRQVDAARRALVAAARAGEGAFDARLGPAGVFPGPRKPRVLWIGLERGARELVSLAAKLDRALEREGFPPSDRPFTPHLTVGRVRDRAPHGAGDGFTSGRFPDDVFHVSHIELVASTLQRGGSQYDVMESAALDPAPSGGDARG